MSFSNTEVSRFRGSPVTLFLFIYGNGPSSYYAYTDAEEEITFEGKVYQPVPIGRGDINSSGTLDKATIDISMPRDLALTELFRVYPPSQVVNLIIRQGHLNDPDDQFLVCWSGRVLSCARQNNEAVFSCEPISTSLTRNGLRRNYQYGCPHVLYGPQCRANKTAATTTVTPTSATGVTITLPVGWTTAPLAQKYLGGMVQWTAGNGDTVLRTILRVTGTNVFTLNGPLNGYVSGTPVNMIKGCNHQMTDCQAVHSNIQNYGGQPWIPLSNPIGMRSQYY